MTNPYEDAVVWFEWVMEVTADNYWCNPDQTTEKQWKESLVMHKTINSALKIAAALHDNIASICSPLTLLEIAGMIEDRLEALAK